MTDPQITHIAELRARGATYGEARLWVAGQERIHRGAYAQIAGLTDERQHLVRARGLLHYVGDVVASHVTAAANLGLPVTTASMRTVHLSPLRHRAGNPKRGPGYHMHTLRVDPEEASAHDGLPSTSALRTVLDCARLLDPDWGVAIADCALHKGLVHSEELHRAARAIRRLKGAERARALPGGCSALAESPGESLLRLRLIRMGLNPREQVSMPRVEGNPKVDFLIDDWLVIEFDGMGKYQIGGDPAAAHWAEKLRNDRLTEAGKVVLHVTWPQLWDEPALRRRVGGVLSRGRRAS